MPFWKRSKLAALSSSGSESDPHESEAELAKRVVRAYHEQTKHHFHRPAYGPMELDWETQPDPFRRYEGAALLPLAVSEPTEEPCLESALVEGGLPVSDLDYRTVSQLFFDSLSVSAWKEAGEARWAVRTNPSSGNLHPTECTALLPALDGLTEHAGVFHYAPREHGLEVRAELPAELWDGLIAELPPGSFLLALSSIHWRESWKYGERAYRYCQHDAGHAIAALSIAAAGLGWKVELVDQLGTEELGTLLGLPKSESPEAEFPDCLLVVGPQGSELSVELPAERIEAFRALDWKGEPNDLSPDHEVWDAIDRVSEAAEKQRTERAGEPWRDTEAAKPVESEPHSLRRIVRQRRSGLAFDGKTGMPKETFFRILESCMPHAGRFPFNALPWSPRIHLALFVHRVEGVEPGLYWLQRDPERLDFVRSTIREDYVWFPVEGCPESLPLSLLLPMDLRRQAAQVSCQQDIAADGAFSLGMIADFDESIEEEGAWIYPRLFWEAGALGQVLYLESEAVGLRSTGIGCYFDDAVHSILGLRDRKLQSLYHFTIGKPVDDARLTTHLAYPDRSPA